MDLGTHRPQPNPDRKSSQTVSVDECMGVWMEGMRGPGRVSWQNKCTVNHGDTLDDFGAPEQPHRPHRELVRNTVALCQTYGVRNPHGAQQYERQQRSFQGTWMHGLYTPAVGRLHLIGGEIEFRVREMTCRNTHTCLVPSNPLAQGSALATQLGCVTLSGYHYFYYYFLNQKEPCIHQPL